MSGILTPGYLRWDGTKYVLDTDIEIVGPTGPTGPTGPIGPEGPPGPSFSAVGGSLGGDLPTPTVTQVDGSGGVLPVIATEVDCNGDTNCKPKTVWGNFLATGSSQATAYSGASLAAAGAYKLNVAGVATDTGGSDCASWDISLLLRFAGGSLSIQGNIPTSTGIIPDNNSSGASGWLLTVDVSGTTPRIRFTATSGVRLGFVYQLIPVVP